MRMDGIEHVITEAHIKAPEHIIFSGPISPTPPIYTGPEAKLDPQEWQISLGPEWKTKKLRESLEIGHLLRIEDEWCVVSCLDPLAVRRYVGQ